MQVIKCKYIFYLGTTKLVTRTTFWFHFHPWRDHFPL